MSAEWEVQIRSGSKAGDAPVFSYRELDSVQRKILGRIQSGGPGAILLSEVSPVITCGRRTVESDLLLTELALRDRGIDLFRTDRGGFATYHGPGQWIFFPVERLEVLTGDSRGVRKGVEALLETALEVVRVYDPEARIEWGPRTGVWGQAGKFAAVGIHVERGVVLHGMALNVYRTPESFVGLRPCGLDASVSFLAETPLAQARLGMGQLAGKRLFFEEIGQAVLAAGISKLSPRIGLTARGSCVKPKHSSVVGA